MYESDEQLTLLIVFFFSYLPFNICLKLLYFVVFVITIFLYVYVFAYIYKELGEWSVKPRPEE